ncbi:hypothetical protein ABPG75_007259 [Micractinium tetrahymenae]
MRKAALCLGLLALIACSGLAEARELLAKSVRDCCCSQDMRSTGTIFCPAGTGTTKWCHNIGQKGQGPNLKGEGGCNCDCTAKTTGFRGYQRCPDLSSPAVLCPLAFHQQDRPSAPIPAPGWLACR